MIKQMLKRWFRNFVVLFALSYFYPGFVVSGGLVSFLLASLLLYFVQVFLHPILKVLYLPVNIVTLGMFSWLIVAAHLLILNFVFNFVKFLPFTYGEFRVFGWIAPGGEINIIFSVILGTIIYRLLRKIVLYIS
jgi:putative membrane protein